VLFAGLGVHRFWLRELSHLTGHAEWVWVNDSLTKVFPTAGLFVASFRLDAPPQEALLKICGDREYVVYANGTAAACGWSRPGFRLDLFDIGHLLRQGENVLAVEVRSPTPVGGLLLSLDVTGVGSNIVVSGKNFMVRPRFSLAPPGPADLDVPVHWGPPPRFPWGYPRPVSHPRTLDEVLVEDPVRMATGEAKELPRGGLEFDLPRPVTGYVWLEFDRDGASYMTTDDGTHRMTGTQARIAAQPVVRLAGQRRWLDPQPRRIGTVFVFGESLPIAVEVWPLPLEFRDGAPGVVQEDGRSVTRTPWTRLSPPS
jgi:hypothetical protein